jgi:large repetitive protein
VQVTPVIPSTGHPTGTVTFFADGNPVATATVNPATGQASFSTASLGLGSHTITADYSGDSNYTSSQSGPTAATVSAAATETVLTTTAVRNKRGRIVKVMIGSQVIAISPVAGTPTGVVTYYRGVHPIASMALSDGSAVDTLKSTRALKKQFTVRYSGVASFDASTSPTVVVTKKSLAMSGRPSTAFLKRR